MITTVTLNPAIDKTIFIKGFEAGKVNRIEESKLDSGGKGINVSKVLATLGAKTLATGFLGGESGRRIHESLISLGIETDFTWVNQETRTNIKIVDLLNNQNTDINDRGKIVDPEAIDDLLQRINKWAKLSKVMVFAGSLPEGMDVGIYQEMIKIAEENGCKTILDTEGESLMRGIKSSPFMIKPNIHELESSLNVNIKGKSDVIQHARYFLDQGVKLIVVSLGEEGALLISEEMNLEAIAIPTEIRSTVGAGDSMVAAFALGLMKGYSMEETLRLAIATATIRVREGNVLNKFEEIQQLKATVKINKID